MNRSPVAPGFVRNPPLEVTAAKWSVSIVSVDEHVGPVMMIPCRHSTRIVGFACSMVPVRSTPAGSKMVWLARSVISNPFMGEVAWIKTETLS